jgi:hypothetical protein
MRMSIFTVALVLAGGSAMASSIEPIHGDRTGNGSILSLNCVQCPALKKNEKVQEYSVPSLASGALETEMREVDGKPEMIRTDALLGGSPVVYISKTQTWFPLDEAQSLAAKAKEPMPANDDGIDDSARTSAIDGSEPVTQAGVNFASQPARTDFSDFSLRLQ